MKPTAIVLTLSTGLLVGTAARAGVNDYAYVEAPVWKTAPTRSDVNAALAGKTWKWADKAYVDVDCEFSPDGALTACHRTVEQPPGSGLGAVALTLLPKFTAFLPAAPAKGPLHVSIEFNFHDPALSTTAVELDDPELRSIKGAPAPVEKFPDTAARAGLASGLAVVACDSVATGALTGCVVVKETPPDLGFGQSAITFVQALNLNPWQNGEPLIGSKVQIPVYIDAPDAASRPTFSRKAIFQVSGREGTAGGYFPDRAYRMGVDGTAVIECVLTADAVLDDCVPVSESVPDFDFLNAALRMAKVKAIKAKPRQVDGQPVAAEVVQVTVPFIIAR